MLMAIPKMTPWYPGCKPKDDNLVVYVRYAGNMSSRVFSVRVQEVHWLSAAELEESYLNHYGEECIEYLEGDAREDYEYDLERCIESFYIPDQSLHQFEVGTVYKYCTFARTSVKWEELLLRCVALPKYPEDYARFEAVGGGGCYVFTQPQVIKAYPGYMV